MDVGLKIKNAKKEKIVKRIGAYGKDYPEMMTHIKRGYIMAYEADGIVCNCNATDIMEIRNFEATLKKYDCIVYAVLHSNMIFEPDEPPINMTSYLYVSNEGNDISAYDENTLYAIAYVVNNTWAIRESGSVLIKPTPAGCPVRVG